MAPPSTLSAELAAGGTAPFGQAPAQRGEVRAEASPPTVGALEELSSAVASARAGLSEFLDLMSLEARRAGLALVWMVALGLVAAVCMVATWLALMAALAMWAIALGFPPIAAVLAVAALNLLAGCGLIYVCIGISSDLLFSATRRQVAGKSLVTPPSP